MRPPSIFEIKAEVARRFKLQPVDLEGTGKRRELSVPRHLAFKLRRDRGKRSYPMIAREFARNHSTIITGIRSIDKRLANEPDLRGHLDAITQRLDQLAAPNSED